MANEKISGKIENYYYSKAIDRRYSESTQHYHPHFEIYYMKDGNCRYMTVTPEQVKQILDYFYQVIPQKPKCKK